MPQISLSTDTDSDQSKLESRLLTVLFIISLYRYWDAIDMHVNPLTLSVNLWYIAWRFERFLHSFAETVLRYLQMQPCISFTAWTVFTTLFSNTVMDMFIVSKYDGGPTVLSQVTVCQTSTSNRFFNFCLNILLITLSVKIKMRNVAANFWSSDTRVFTLLKLWTDVRDSHEKRH